MDEEAEFQQCRHIRSGKTATRILKCNICGHVWSPRGKNDPIKCPSCRSIRWNMDVIRNTCKICGHSWMSERQDCNKCPNCQSTKWAQYPIVCECVRCGHKWNSRNGKPDMCPSCKTHLWMEPIHYWTCPNCGKRVVLRNNTRFGLCPSCDKSRRVNSCIRCNHVWKSSRRLLPKYCPRCNSADWSDRGGGDLN